LIDVSIEVRPEFYNTALVLLSATVCGPNPVQLAALTGLPYSFIAPICRRMIQAELWTHNEVHCDDWYMGQGVLYARCFWLDVLVAEGFVMRKWNEEQGRYCYGCQSDVERVN
jgi:hypothetical protein